MRKYKQVAQSVADNFRVYGKGVPGELGRPTPYGWSGKVCILLNPTIYGKRATPESREFFAKLRKEIAPMSPSSWSDNTPQEEIIKTLEEL